MIDGDFVEQFLLLSKAKQLDVVKRMVTGQVKGDETLQSLLLQILQGLTKHHWFKLIMQPLTIQHSTQSFKVQISTKQPIDKDTLKRV